MADNFLITEGSGRIISAHENVDGSLEQNIRVTTLPTLSLPTGASTEATLAAIKAKTDNLDVLLSTRTKPSDTQPISGAVSVSNFPATQPVSGPLTDTQLRAVAVPVSGTFYPATQPVSGTFWQATQPMSVASLPLPTGASTETTLAAAKVDLDKFTFTATRLLVDGSGTTQPVSGTFWQATQPISAANLPLPSGASTETTLAAAKTDLDKFTFSATRLLCDGSGVTQPVSVAAALSTISNSAPLLVTATGATGAAVTVTLPAVASQFHYLTFITVLKYFTAANAASATPLLVTSTNLPGSYTLSFSQPLGTIGTTEERVYPFNFPMKSSVVNTATTIVCPATVGIIWRVTVHYYSAA